MVVKGEKGGKSVPQPVRDPDFCVSRTKGLGAHAVRVCKSEWGAAPRLTAAAY